MGYVFIENFRNTFFFSPRKCTFWIREIVDFQQVAKRSHQGEIFSWDKKIITSALRETCYSTLHWFVCLPLQNRGKTYLCIVNWSTVLIFFPAICTRGALNTQYFYLRSSSVQQNKKECISFSDLLCSKKGRAENGFERFFSTSSHYERVSSEPARLN